MLSLCKNMNLTRLHSHSPALARIRPETRMLIGSLYVTCGRGRWRKLNHRRLALWYMLDGRRPVQPFSGWPRGARSICRALSGLHSSCHLLLGHTPAGQWDRTGTDADRDSSGVAHLVKLFPVPYKRQKTCAKRQACCCSLEDIMSRALVSHLSCAEHIGCLDRMLPFKRARCDGKVVCNESRCICIHAAAWAHV